MGVCRVSDEWADMVKCNFCSKRGKQVKVLICSRSTYICNECIAMCVDILIDRTLPSNIRPINADHQEDEDDTATA